MVAAGRLRISWLSFFKDPDQGKILFGLLWVSERSFLVRGGLKGQTITVNNVTRMGLLR